MTITATRPAPAAAAPVRPTRLLPSTAGFAATAVTFAALYVAAGAPTPLLVVFQQQWHFPASVLTVAFAAYALGLLAAILVTGAMSGSPRATVARSTMARPRW